MRGDDRPQNFLCELEDTVAVATGGSMTHRNVRAHLRLCTMPHVDSEGCFSLAVFLSRCVSLSLCFSPAVFLSRCVSLAVFLSRCVSLSLCFSSIITRHNCVCNICMRGVIYLHTIVESMVCHCRPNCQQQLPLNMQVQRDSICKFLAMHSNYKIQLQDSRDSQKAHR